MSSINWRPNKNSGLFLKAIALLGVTFLIAAGYFYVGVVREETADTRPLAIPIFDSDASKKRSLGIFPCFCQSMAFPNKT